MKKTILLAALAFVVFSFTHVTTYKVDTTASNIIWNAEKVTGKHTGTVKIKNGALQVDHGRLIGGSFEIDMTSITNIDLEGEWAAKLVGHIKSDDFFGVDKYPTAKFVITRAIPQDTKGNYKIIGNLTIKEKTDEITFKANVTEAAGALTAIGDIVVDRSKFDVKYGSGSFFDNLGDKTIYDEFGLKVSLVARQ